MGTFPPIFIKGDDIWQCFGQIIWICTPMRLVYAQNMVMYENAEALEVVVLAVGIKTTGELKMSVRAYLVRILDFYVEDGYSVFRYEDTKQEIFNLWHDNGIVEMIQDFGTDATNEDGCGTMEITLEGLLSFKSTDAFKNLSDEELSILATIEKELRQSKFDMVQFDCY